MRMLCRRLLCFPREFILSDTHVSRWKLPASGVSAVPPRVWQEIRSLCDMLTNQCVRQNWMLP